MKLAKWATVSPAAFLRSPHVSSALRGSQVERISWTSRAPIAVGCRETSSSTGKKRMPGKSVSRARPMTRLIEAPSETNCINRP
jgi:hypothetical protein